MPDQQKTRRQQTDELAMLRQRVAELESAEKERQLCNERYRLLAEAIPQMLWQADGNRQTVQCNPRWCEYTGQTCEETRGLGWMKTLHPDDVAQVMQCLRDGQAAGSLYEAEYRIRRASDGGYRWHLSRAVPMKDEQGKITGWFGSVTDIDDQKRAAETLKRTRNELERQIHERTAELRESEQKYRSLVETSPDTVVLADLQGRVTFVSQGILPLHGSDDIEAFLGKHPLDFVVPEDRDRLLANIQRTLREEATPNNEYTFVRQDGSRVPAEVSSALIRDAAGRPKALMAIIRDISQRKQSQRVLQQAHDELRAIYDQVVDGIIIVDADVTRPVRTNMAYCRMLGYSKEESLDLSPERVHPPEALPAVWKHLEEVRQGHVSQLENLPFLRKDGSVGYADVISSPLFYNQRPCSIAFFHDVTQRKRVEEALRNEHETLKHLLQSSDHERQLIAYEIHDGLAQHLAGALMQFDAFAHLKDAQPQKAADAYHVGLTMLRQSHFEARRLIAGVRPPILDESGVVEAVAHLVNEQSRLKGPEIEYRSRVGFDRLAPTLENAIYRIVQEGLANACRHSKSGKVRVSLVQQENRLRIEMRDWGIGFDAKTVRGNHFGLEGIRQRTRLLGGKYRLRSSPGKGTQIVVELPVVLRD